jgi:hypothetical protein
MTVHEQIEQYISQQPQPKGDELRALSRIILGVAPAARLWFLDGKNEDGKVVSNPNIGYGVLPHKYANGETKDFYRIGFSANSAGISVYVMGIDDKKYLSQTYGARLGKAKITGYCIKFRSIRDIDLDVFAEMVESLLGGSPP